MKTQTVKGKMENAYGKALAAQQYNEGFSPVNSLPYEGTWEAYTSIEEVKAANDFPSDKQVVKLLNTARKNKARAQYMTEALDAAGIIKPTLETDDQLKLKTMYDVFKSVKGTSETEAREKASNALGIAWADEDED